MAFLFLRLFKKFPNQDILDISEFLGGKFLKVIVGMLFFIFFIGGSSIILRTFADSLRLTYFDNFATPTILLFILIAVAAANLIQPKAIIKCNFIITPLMMISLLIPLLSATPSFAVQRIFPLFGYGLEETFLSGATNIFAFCGLSVLFFLPPLLKNQKDLKKVTIWSAVITGFFLLVSVGSLLLSLPFVFDTEELSPIFLLIRSFDLGNFFQRPEAIFTLIWILAMISYVSVFVMFSLFILKKLLNLSNPQGLSFCITSFIFILAVIPQNMAKVDFLESTVYKYYTLGVSFFLPFLILILSSIKKKRQDSQKPMIKGSEAYEKT